MGTGEAPAAPEGPRGGTVKEEKGQDLVEFALIAPVLFLLLLGIMEFGVAVWHYNTIANAAREGARAAILFDIGKFMDPEYPEPLDRVGLAERQAITFATGIGLDEGDLTVTVTETARSDLTTGDFDGSGLNAIVVEIELKYEGITGLVRLIPQEITMRARSTMITEEIYPHERI